MEKTFYKNLMIFPTRGIWRCQFEFADDPEGFFMQMVFEVDTKEEAEQKFESFIGENSELLTT
jgi:hypothetical protein